MCGKGAFRRPWIQVPRPILINRGPLKLHNCVWQTSVSQAFPSYNGTFGETGIFGDFRNSPKILRFLSSPTRTNLVHLSFRSRRQIRAKLLRGRMRPNSKIHPGFFDYLTFIPANVCTYVQSAFWRWWRGLFGFHRFHRLPMRRNENDRISQRTQSEPQIRGRKQLVPTTVSVAFVRIRPCRLRPHLNFRRQCWTRYCKKTKNFYSYDIETRESKLPVLTNNAIVTSLRLVLTPVTQMVNFPKSEISNIWMVRYTLRRWRCQKNSTYI